MTELDFLSVRFVFVRLPPVPISSSSAHPSSALVTARLLASSGYPTSCSHNSLRVSTCQASKTQQTRALKVSRMKVAEEAVMRAKHPSEFLCKMSTFFVSNRLLGSQPGLICLSVCLTFCLDYWNLIIFYVLNFVNFSLLSFLFFSPSSPTSLLLSEKCVPFCTSLRHIPAASMPRFLYQNINQCLDYLISAFYFSNLTSQRHKPVRRFRPAWK